MAVNYLKWLTDVEEYGVFEAVVTELVKLGDLSDPIVRALVSTCIEPHSIQILKNRASGSDPFAEQVLQLSPGFDTSPKGRDTETLQRADVTESPDKTSESSNPDRHLKYPPERLPELLQSEALSSSYARSEEFCAWLCRWADTDQAAEALGAAESYMVGDERLMVSNVAVAAATRIGGRTGSYKWLVRAQRSNNGWIEYWTDREEAKERWRSVKRDFPDKWHDFLTKSIRPPAGFTAHYGMTIARLVEYLLLFGRCDDASTVAYQLVESIGDLVSGQKLPVPDWIEENSLAV